MKVYIISTYEEHSAENCRATLDKSKVMELLTTHPEYDESRGYGETVKLAKLLEADTPDGMVGLTDGWGGFTLHIIELE